MHVRLEIKKLRVQPPSGLQHSFVDIDHEKIFCGHSLPFADSRRAVVSFGQKNVHNIG